MPVPPSPVPSRLAAAVALLAASASAQAPDRAIPEPASFESVRDSAEARKKRGEDTAVPPPATPAALEARKRSRDAAGDTTGADTTLTFYDYVAHPVLQAVTLPIDWVLVPTAKTLLLPAREPLRYFLKEDVIDRTIKLISFGKEERVMLYPTLNLAQGTGSYTGLTLRHTALFGRPQERLVAMGNIYVNGDWRFRSYVTARELFGTDWESKASIQFTRQKNNSMNQPGTNRFWAFADTSNNYQLTLGHPLVEALSWRVGGGWRQNHYGPAPPQEDTLESDFFRNEEGVIDPASRGLGKDWNDWYMILGLSRDTRSNENIPLAGSDARFNWHYHWTDEGHGFQGWEGVWSGFFKLGRERYEITSQEERQRGGMDVRKMLKEIDLKRLRDQMFTRKVVALHLYAARAYESGDERMPVYGLATLGNNTPMRGYSGSRFRDYAVAAASMEYRFPVMRLMDGVFFNEYGVFGRAFPEIDWSERLRNSWGLGIRVRRPDIFLFRTDFGFHGLHGIVVNLSVDAAY